MTFSDQMKNHVGGLIKIHPPTMSEWPKIALVKHVYFTSKADDDCFCILCILVDGEILDRLGFYKSDFEFL